MPLLPDVIVVGGGAIGSACARELAASGAAVTIIDPVHREGAAWQASAGMLAAQVEANADDPALDLSLAGRDYFNTHVAALQRTTGIDVGHAQTGILEVAHSEAAAAPLRERVAWQRQQALRADWLDADDVADSWPWLAACAGAFWSPEDGVIDPVQLVAAQTADAIRLGAHVIHDVVTELDTSNGTLRGVRSERERYDCGTVVIAAGAWSGRIERLPRPLSVEPVRGQMLAFPWPANTRPAVVYGEQCYLLHRRGEMLVGATVEHAGFTATTDPEALDSLHARAARTCPSIESQRPLRAWAGLRPGTPDGLPVIGPEPRLLGLWYATGHGRNGILMSGVTGSLVCRGISGTDVTEELAPFRPDRFWS